MTIPAHPHPIKRVLIDTDAHNEGHLAIAQALAINDLIYSLTTSRGGLEAVSDDSLSNALFCVDKLLRTADSLLDWQPLSAVESVDEVAFNGGAAMTRRARKAARARKRGQS